MAFVSLKKEYIALSIKTMILSSLIKYLYFKYFEFFKLWCTSCDFTLKIEDWLCDFMLFSIGQCPLVNALCLLIAISSAADNRT